RAAIPTNIRAVLESAAQGANWSARPLNRSVAWAVSNSTVEKVGTDQVRIHLSRPYPAFLQSIAFTVGSIVEKACAATWDDWGARNPMLDRRRDCGTGPYLLTGWVPNQAIVLTGFDGYWGTPAALDGVRIEKANDVTAREFLLLSGDADTAVINRDHQFDVVNPDGTPRYPWLRIPGSRPSLNITLYYNAGNTERRQGCLLLRQGLQALHDQLGAGPISVGVRALDWPAYLGTLRARGLPIFFLGWRADYADPDDYVLPFLRTG